jgi:predicted nucleotidyltransferase
MLGENEFRQCLGENLSRVVTKLLLQAGQRVRPGAPSAPDDTYIRTSANIEKMLEELVVRGIEFVIIGGLAGRVYCSTNATDDLDICHARSPENLKAIASLLKDLNATFRRPPQHAPAELTAATLSTEMDFIFETDLGKLDLIGHMTGVGDYAEAAEDAVTVEIAGHPVKVLSLPKLMIAKLNAGRPKDLRLVNELEAVKQARRLLDGCGHAGRMPAEGDPLCVSPLVRGRELGDVPDSR